MLTNKSLLNLESFNANPNSNDFLGIKPQKLKAFLFLLKLRIFARFMINHNKACVANPYYNQ